MKRLLIVTLLLIPISVLAEPIYNGKVIHISDGDTLKILVNNTPFKIRLSDIDAPEKGQHYGNKAKQALGNLVFGQRVMVVQGSTDSSGRIVGRVYLGNLDVNAWMVEQGHAWVDRKYSKDLTLYKLENKAKAARRGLWGSDLRVPPWEWRRNNGFLVN